MKIDAKKNTTMNNKAQANPEIITYHVFKINFLKIFSPFLETMILVYIFNEIVFSPNFPVQILNSFVVKYLINGSLSVSYLLAMHVNKSVLV